MESGALLLTATITPQPGVPHFRVTDTAQRRQEYLTSLAFAIALDRRIITTIVFAENSGSDLSAFKSLAERDDRVELLSVSPGRLKPPGGGATWKRASYSMRQGHHRGLAPRPVYCGKRQGAMS